MHLAPDTCFRTAAAAAFVFYDYRSGVPESWNRLKGYRVVGAHFIANKAFPVLFPNKAVLSSNPAVPTLACFFSMRETSRIAPVGQTWPHTLQFTAHAARRGTMTGLKIPSSPALSQTGWRVLVAHAFMHSPQRTHRVRKSASGSVAGGRINSGSINPLSFPRGAGRWMPVCEDLPREALIPPPVPIPRLVRSGGSDKAAHCCPWKKRRPLPDRS